jgi:aspartyl-tRNA(Asn)/glutamyl-tRNA(Gln) amidotransferase subunit C
MLVGQVGNILDYIDKLEQADTEGVAPTTHAISLVNALREDKVHEHPGAESNLANAPQQEDHCFVVPKIVG